MMNVLLLARQHITCYWNSVFYQMTKSYLIPSQHLEVLGHMINSVKMTVFLPKHKEEIILALWHQLLNTDSCSI